MASSYLMPANRPTPNIWLVGHGDSITLGTTLPLPETQSYPWLVANAATTAVPSRFIGLQNFGINGQGLNYIYSVPPSNTFGTLIADAVTRVDPVLAYVGTKYLIIFAGTNDIFLNGTSGSGTWTLLQTYINARVAAGWLGSNICVVTMLPRQGMHESDRTTYNGLIRSNQAGLGYKIADAAANSTIGDAGNEFNATYYSDTIHPTPAGQLILQQIISAVLFP